jgi:hypothetical protein
MKRIAFVLFLMLAAGCAARGHLLTPSGKPEITVPANLDQSQHASKAWLLRNGYEIGQKFVVDGVMLEGGKDVTSGFWSAMGGTDDEYVIFNFIARDSSNTTIYVNKQTESYRVASGGQHTLSMTQNYSQEDFENLQKALVEISDSLKSHGTLN